MLCLLGVVFSDYTKLTLTRAPLILKRNIIQHILIYFGGKPSRTFTFQDHKCVVKEKVQIYELQLNLEHCKLLCPIPLICLLWSFHLFSLLSTMARKHFKSYHKTSVMSFKPNKHYCMCSLYERNTIYVLNRSNNS